MLSLFVYKYELHLVCASRGTLNALSLSILSVRSKYERFSISFAPSLECECELAQQIYGLSKLFPIMHFIIILFMKLIVLIFVRYCVGVCMSVSQCGCPLSALIFFFTDHI